MSVFPVSGLSQFDNTLYGHYRRLRWLILIRELSYLPGSLLAIWRLRGEHFDILHLNEVTLLPLGIVAKKLLGVPMVVHVRSLQCLPRRNWRAKIINLWLGRFADAIVPIDHTVAKTLDAALPVNIVHNGLQVGSSIEAKKVARSPNRWFRVGFLGVLIPLKGIFELVEAIRILKDRGVAIQCVVAGEDARELNGIRGWALRILGFGRNVRAELNQIILKYGLERHVQLLGFVKDIRALYPTLDALCFPSHLNSAGRPVFEAAFFEVPSVVAVENPLPDAVLHEQTGLAIPRPEPKLIADALQRLVEDDAFRLMLGRQARAWAVDKFSIEKNAAAVFEIYDLLARRGQ